MSDEEKPSWEWRLEVIRLREQLKGVQKVRDEYHQQWMDASDAEEVLKQQLAQVTQERDALKRERREYGMALTQEELRDPEYMQGYCEDFGVDYHREVQARVNLEQQLAAVTEEREDAVRIAIGLIAWAPITDADVKWANERLAAHKHQEGLP